MKCYLDDMCYGLLTMGDNCTVSYVVNKDVLLEATAVGGTCRIIENRSVINE